MIFRFTLLLVIFGVAALMLYDGMWIELLVYIAIFPFIELILLALFPDYFRGRRLFLFRNDGDETTNSN